MTLFDRAAAVTGTKRVLAVTSVGAVLALGACGGGDDTTTAVVGASGASGASGPAGTDTSGGTAPSKLVQGLIDQQGLSPDQASCVAGKLQDLVTSSELQELESTGTIDPDAQQALSQALSQCGGSPGQP